MNPRLNHGTITAEEYVRRLEKKKIQKPKIKVAKKTVMFNDCNIKVTDSSNINDVKVSRGTSIDDKNC